jgi:hypothetical protein
MHTVRYRILWDLRIRFKNVDLPSITPKHRAKLRSQLSLLQTHAPDSSSLHIYNIVLPRARVLVIVPRLGRLICFPRSPVLFSCLLQRLVVCLSFLRVELLLEVAGGGLVVAGLGVVLVCDCNADEMVVRAMRQTWVKWCLVRQCAMTRFLVLRAWCAEAPSYAIDVERRAYTHIIVDGPRAS